MYNSNNVAERIKFVAKSKGISIKKLLMDIGLGKNTMSNFKTSMPKADNLAKIADCLDCSVDFLLGRTDIPDLYPKAVREYTAEEYMKKLDREREIAELIESMRKNGEITAGAEKKLIENLLVRK